MSKKYVFLNRYSLWFLLLEYWIKYVLGMSAYLYLDHFLHVQHGLGMCVCVHACVCSHVCVHVCVCVRSFVSIFIWFYLSPGIVFNSLTKLLKSISVTQFLNSVTFSESLCSPWFLCHPLPLKINLLWLHRVQSSP